MFLRSLSLAHFRNYSQLNLTLEPGLNLLVGPNGSGKSNFLEAVSVLAAGQSHRGSEPRYFFREPQPEWALKARFEGEETFVLEARQKKGRPRQVLLNTHPQKRSKDWIGRAPVVSFSPEDMELIKGEPSLRRRTLNAALCQMDGEYWDTLQRYNKILEERNAALRLVQDGEKGRSFLDPWDAPLLSDGLFITLARQRYIDEFSRAVDRAHGRLWPQERASLVYRPSFLGLDDTRDPEILKETNRRRLEGLREGEIALGTTLAGPHRDDMEFWLDNRPAKAFASQGQQRTLALAFKMAEHGFLKERLGREPLCLLDDMLSELDPGRRENLAALLCRNSQCLMTLTHLTDWPAAAKTPRDMAAAVFDVKAGAVHASQIPIS